MQQHVVYGPQITHEIFGHLVKPFAELKIGDLVFTSRSLWRINKITPKRAYVELVVRVTDAINLPTIIGLSGNENGDGAYIDSYYSRSAVVLPDEATFHRACQAFVKHREALEKAKAVYKTAIDDQFNDVIKAIVGEQ